MPSAVGSWLWFPGNTLDAKGPLAGVLTFCWRILDDPQDPWTARVMAFKTGDAQAVRAAVAVVARDLSTLTFTPPPVAVTAAIGSAHTCTSPTSSLAQFGAGIATALSVPWLPNLLTKAVHPSLHNIKAGGAARDAAVHGKYIATPQLLTRPGTILLVDDLVTRGATLNDAARALLQTYPKTKVIGIALAKNERHSWASVSNAHVPSQLASAWDRTP